MINDRIEVSETFEKETKVVVIFKEKGMYKKDCESLRNTLGQVFPSFLVKKQNCREPVLEKWLMRKSYYNDERLIKDKNLTSLENELKKNGITLDYKYANVDMIRMFPEEISMWENSIRNWIEDDNKKIKALKNKFCEEGLISLLDIQFSIGETTIETGEGNISGNYFSIKTKSEKGCEALKIAHKQIVKALLEVLEPLDGISMIRYYCGDIEHQSHSKIACVLD